MPLSTILDILWPLGTFIAFGAIRVHNLRNPTDQWIYPLSTASAIFWFLVPPLFLLGALFLLCDDALDRLSTDVAGRLPPRTTKLKKNGAARVNQ